MSKDELLAHINRYHLSGMVESVVWQINDGKVQISFVSQINSTAGIIMFPFVNVGSSENMAEEIGISNTSALVKLLVIMQQDIDVSFDQEHNIWMKLNVTDGAYKGSFSLADIRTIPEAPEIDEPTAYEVSFPLDKEFKDQFAKAYKALGSINRFEIEAAKDVKITLGNKESYANKVSFKRNMGDHLPLRKIAFSGEAMFEILKNNPDLTESEVEISEQGLMKVTVYGGSDKVIYYLIELEEV